MKTLIFTVSFIIITIPFFAQPFSNLKELKDHGCVLYEPSITTLINKSIDDPYGETVYHLLKTKVEKSSSVLYVITFDYGPSEDHTYNIYKETSSGSLIHISEIGAEKLVIPGNGYIYSSGRNNQLYDKKRKFKLSGESLTEVEQGAYYIGLKTQTNKTITLYSDKDKKNKTAVLPKNYDIEILIEKNKCILIKTAFGLTGWAKLSDLNTYDMTGESLSIKNFYYAGD